MVAGREQGEERRRLRGDAAGEATAPQPPSRLAMRSSNTATVGFMIRE